MGEKTAGTGLEQLTELFNLLTLAGGQSGAKAQGGVKPLPRRGLTHSYGAHSRGTHSQGAHPRGAKAAEGVTQAAPPRRRGRKSWPGSEETKRLRGELDEIGLAFRLCKGGVNPPEGWMRAVRQAIGLPVADLARRMGVAKSQVFRLEESEQEGRVRVATLRRAAEAMGCELVYALVPREGKLASLAATLRAEDAERREQEAAQRRARKKEEWKSAEWAPRRETIRQEAERLGIAAEIYGQ
jgi:predicted DNA-binding mobile mystery protein A